MCTVADVLKNKAMAQKFRSLKFEITDKGSEFIRCAVKMTNLLNVMHLSLPDNLLGFKEAQIISSMIRKNPQLRILNLSYNSFDHESGRIIGDALLRNSNLQALDISYNRLGDLGVRNLIYPILITNLCKIGIFKKEDGVIMLDDKNLDEVRSKPTLEQNDELTNEHHILSGLTALSIKENYTT